MLKHKNLYDISLVLMVFVSLAAPRSLAYLPLCLGLMLNLFFYARFGIRPSLPRAGLWMTAGLVGWILISSLWALSPETSLERAAKIAMTLGGGLLWLGLSRPMTRKGTYALTGLYIGGCLVLAIKCYAHMPISRFFLRPGEGDYLPLHSLNRACVILALLLVPILAIVQKMCARRRAAFYWQGLIISALFIGLSRCDSQTAQMTATIALLFFYAAFLYRRGLLFCLAAAMMLYCFFAPFAAMTLHEKFIESSREISFLKAANAAPRMEIWGFVAAKIMEKPWFGHGIEATRFMKSDHWMTHMGADTALHPHNAVLQIWIEFGFAGIAALNAFLLFLFARCRAMTEPLAQKTALATLMAAFCVMNTGYGLWQGWQLGLMILLFSLITIIEKQKEEIRYS